MIRGILFDMGGTLDGDGLHWLDRFVALYAGSGLTVPRDRVRAAFDEAERLAALDDEIARAGLDVMMVGDSFDRDVRPAKRVGMMTGWLEGCTARACPEPALVDLRLHRLADLPAAIDMRASA